MSQSETDVSQPTGAFLKLAAACWVLVVLAAVSTVVGGLQNNSQVFEIGLAAVLLSLAGVSLSLLGYTVRSFQKQQWLQAQRSAYSSSTPIRDIVRAFKIAGQDSRALNEYEKRVQKTVTGFVLALMAGALPLRIVFEVVISVL